VNMLWQQLVAGMCLQLLRAHLHAAASSQPAAPPRRRRHPAPPNGMPPPRSLRAGTIFTELKKYIQEQPERFVDIFNQYDVDHDGRLSLDEIKGMIILEFLPQATQQELNYFVVRPCVQLIAASRCLRPAPGVSNVPPFKDMVGCKLARWAVC
jgi:hypothetical protein